ncbi:HD domain-containing protein [Mycolicibacterium sp. NCC-Tsukiji]|uniref:HD domain-containing protein n=1 Tax=Mycolicibacterium sp. NCC-Tsukiji TaxID=2185272 RepID=UPI000EC5C356|nr:HD domain-containing protein [Mycolicibacterium sp. NCC-Tsukiji]GCA97805.1 cyanamide hydratase [Mycolicibacterium sp. NCC-Tsukiji]
MSEIVITAPDTPAARAALRVGEQYYGPGLLNHCVRSYHWAVLCAGRRQIAVDRELLYVAALLHDIGLVSEFDHRTASFELSGADVAWVFGAAAGWSDTRCAKVGDAVIAHVGTDVVSPAIDPEGHLLNIATSLDVLGTDCEEWSVAERTAVLDRYPRLDICTEIIECFRTQADHKPDSFPARALDQNALRRIHANPLDRTDSTGVVAHPAEVRPIST